MATLPNFRIEASPTDSGTTIKLAGELDSATCGELVERFEQLITDNAGEVVLDLDEVTFIDSAGLRALIVIERTAGERNLAFTIRTPTGPVADLLQLTGIREHVALSPRLDAPPPTMPFTERVELELARNPAAPARARAELRETLADGVGEADRATLILLTSELVTNAVIHSGADAGDMVRLRITVYPDRVRIEVTDPGSGFEVGNLPSRPRDFGGHGLVVVEGLSSRWGTTRAGAGGGFCVWFELDYGDGATGEAADDELAADTPAETSVAAEG
ncbi:MAG TPA: anti-sigma factor antagonist [Solirubrobacteraceae bacterium]|nr:anti-sigma factor antagonist [Solirubrobacteraceae bacterium]